MTKTKMTKIFKKHNVFRLKSSTVAIIIAVLTFVITGISVLLFIQYNADKEIDIYTFEKDESSDGSFPLPNTLATSSDGISMTAEDTYFEFEPGVFYFLKGNVQFIPDIEEGLAFSATNNNSADAIVKNIYVDVLKYEPYDYLYVGTSSYGGDGYDIIYINECRISTDTKRYVADHVPMYHGKDIVGQPIYIKINANGGSETFSLRIVSDTPGIYYLDVKLEYILKDKTVIINIAKNISFVQYPEEVSADKAFAIGFFDATAGREGATVLYSMDDIESFIKRNYPDAQFLQTKVNELILKHKE